MGPSTIGFRRSLQSLAKELDAQVQPNPCLSATESAPNLTKVENQLRSLQGKFNKALETKAQCTLDLQAADKKLADISAQILTAEDQQRQCIAQKFDTKVAPHLEGTSSSPIIDFEKIILGQELTMDMVNFGQVFKGSEHLSEDEASSLVHLQQQALGHLQAACKDLFGPAAATLQAKVQEIVAQAAKVTGKRQRVSLDAVHPGVATGGAHPSPPPAVPEEPPTKEEPTVAAAEAAATAAAAAPPPPSAADLAAAKAKLVTKFREEQMEKISQAAKEKPVQRKNTIYQEAGAATSSATGLTAKKSPPASG